MMLIDNNVLPKVQGNNRPLKAFPKKFALVLVLPLLDNQPIRKEEAGHFVNELRRRLLALRVG